LAALAWTLQHDRTVTIPGTRRVARLEENAAAAAITLSAAELDRIDAAAPPGAAIGARYPAERMTAVNR